MDRFDVVYGTRPGGDVHLDIYQPTGPTNRRTAILLLHGGGFRAGDRKMLQPQCMSLAGRGFTAIAVQYRLVDDTDVTWPAPLDDVKGAIAWTRAHADEIDIDPDKIVLQGHSAGAQLALMAIGTLGNAEFDPPFELEAPEAPVAGLVVYYPLVQFVVREMPTMNPDEPPDPEFMTKMIKAMSADDGTTPASMLMGPTATDEQAASASPINYVHDGFPPTLIFHGTADMVVAPAASSKLFDTLQSAGVAAELHLFAGVGHAFEGTPSLFEPCAALTESFLQRIIFDPAGFAEEEATHNPIAAMMRAQA
jgi:acetyl esterase/lipase